MGLIATFVFVIILYVGITAIVGLEVPYAGFEKGIVAGVQSKQQ